jgi:hypothetical protein
MCSGFLTLALSNVIIQSGGCRGLVAARLVAFGLGATPLRSGFSLCCQRPTAFFGHTVSRKPVPKRVVRRGRRATDYDRCPTPQRVHGILPQIAERTELGPAASAEITKARRGASTVVRQCSTCAQNRREKASEVVCGAMSTSAHMLRLAKHCQASYFEDASASTGCSHPSRPPLMRRPTAPAATITNGS